ERFGPDVAVRVVPEHRLVVEHPVPRARLDAFHDETNTLRNELRRRFDRRVPPVVPADRLTVRGKAVADVGVTHLDRLLPAVLLDREAVRVEVLGDEPEHRDGQVTGRPDFLLISKELDPPTVSWVHNLVSAVLEEPIPPSVVGVDLP